MVLPVTATPQVFEVGAFYDYVKRGWRQAYPIDRPLPYYMSYNYGKERVHWTDSTFKRADLTIDAFPDGQRQRTHTYNVAYERLRDELMQKAGWAENLAQIDKSRKLINDRLTQIARFASAVKRKRFGDARRALQVSLDPSFFKNNGVAKTFLEYQYGIAPLMSDVENSIEILTETEFWTLQKKGTKRSSSRYRFTDVSTSGNWTATTTADGMYDIRVACRAGIRVDNPNLFLANQLGILDPALPWKLVPFSFVVDWFINVEQVLSSMTDWYGCSLLHPHWSEHMSMTMHNRESQLNAITGEYVWSDYSRTSVRFERLLGLPAPDLVLKPFKGLSLARGIAACALVISIFGS